MVSATPIPVDREDFKKVLGNPGSILTLSNCNGPFHSLFLIDLKQVVGVKGLIMGQVKLKTWRFLAKAQSNVRHTKGSSTQILLAENVNKFPYDRRIAIA